MYLEALLIVELVTEIKLLSSITFFDVGLSEILKIFMNYECLFSVVAMHSSEHKVPSFYVSFIILID